MSQEKLIFLQMQDTASFEELDQIKAWLSKNRPEGYKFILSNDFHAWTKQEIMDALNKAEREGAAIVRA